MKAIYLFKAAVYGSALLLVNFANAQMTGTDVFLKGRYVEVGIGHNGYYGSDSISPAGYHPHFMPTNTRIGFVADPGMTGWDTSAASHYTGDYFLPGFPFEGWSMQIDTFRCQGYNSGSSASLLSTNGPAASGANVSYTATGSKVSGKWQGIFDSVGITQVTTLDTNDMFFSVAVTFTNLSSAPVNNIYYFRSVDPDNDESWPGGSFVTDNVINYQMPDTFNVSAVTATGLSAAHPALTLGTTDTASRAVIYMAWPISLVTDLAQVYAENTSVAGGSFYTTGTVHSFDIAIGLIMNIPHLASVDSAADSVLRTTASGTLHPANTATIHYFYAFGAAGLDSAIAHGHAAGLGGTLVIKNVNSTAVKVYPNPSKDYVTITGLTTSDHITLYDMMGRTIDQNWVSHDGTNTFRYNNVPSGAYILTVTDINGKIKARLPLRKQ